MLDPKRKLFRWGPIDACPLFMYYTIPSSFKKMHYIFDHCYPESIIIFENKKVLWLLDDQDFLNKGMEFTKEELMTIGERIYTLERMFNVREGFSRKDDTLPERFFKEPTNRGLPIVKGKKIDRKKFNQMIKEYYELHAWNEEGIPTEETLKKLGLDEEIPGIL